MTYFVTTRRRIIVSDPYWSWSLDSRCRALMATATAHIYAVYVPSNDSSTWRLPFWPSPTAWVEIVEVLFGTHDFAQKMASSTESYASAPSWGLGCLHGKWVGLCVGVQTPAFQVRGVTLRSGNHMVPLDTNWYLMPCRISNMLRTPTSLLPTTQEIQKRDSFTRNKNSRMRNQY